MIGKLSEEFEICDDIWNFKCLIIKYDNFVFDEKCYVENKEYNLEMIKAFQQDTIDAIRKATKEYIETTKFSKT